MIIIIIIIITAVIFGEIVRKFFLLVFTSSMIYFSSSIISLSVFNWYREKNWNFLSWCAETHLERNGSAELRKDSSCSDKHQWAVHSSAEAPAGYPNKNSNNRKNRKRAGYDGKRAEASLLSSPFPSCPARSLFFLPSFPTIQRGLCGGERMRCKRSSSWSWKRHAH